MRAPQNWFVYLTGVTFAGVCFAGAVFAYVLYAANATAPTRPVVTISETIPANAGVAGQPVVVFAQASDPDGIAEVGLWVNGRQAGSQANPDQGNLLPFKTSQAWVPDGAGNYLIVLKATDRKGFAGESEPVILQVQERGRESEPATHGEYAVQSGDTLEGIAALFGTTPDGLRVLNPDLGELTPGAIVLVPPRPEGEAGGDAAGAPPAGGVGELPRIDPPLPAPAPGAETEPEPVAEVWWIALPFSDGFGCLFNPESCARAIDLEPAPFPAPAGVGFAAGEGCAIDVSWTDNSENEDGFRIYRFVSRPRFRIDLLEIVGPASGSGARLHFPDASPPRGSFFYAVVAYNAGGDTWSGPSETVESEGCPPAGPIVVQPLVVEGLQMAVPGSFERLYCYASLAGSPFERVPAGASNFINLASGSWDIAEHFSGSNKREVMAPAAGPLSIVVECLGWQGEELTNLGRFTRAHPPEEWDGRPLMAGPATGGFSLTYRIQYSFHAADEGGRAAWPLIDARLPAPFNLRTTEDTADCRLPPDRREPGDPCQRTVLAWDYTPAETAPRLPTAYKIYRRSPGGSVPILYHTTVAATRSAPLATDDCNERVLYSVSAVVGSDEVTGEEIQSPLSDEFEVPPSCASLEITLETLWVYGVYDGDPCTIFDDCHNDYEAYGWLDFNGRRIRWNDHCDTGFFDFDGCVYVGPSYTTLPEASSHNWSAFMLNTGDGWRRSNNVIRVPVVDGTALTLTFTLMDHDSDSPDEGWCGSSGRTALMLAGRPASAWQAFDQVLEADEVGNCIIRFRVRGIP
jgi:hypothetical protein